MPTYTSTNTFTPITVSAIDGSEAARKVVAALVLKELRRLQPMDLGGDPLTDLFSTEEGSYIIEFDDGSRVLVNLA